MTLVFILLLNSQGPPKVAAAFETREACTVYAITTYGDNDTSTRWQCAAVYVPGDQGDELE
jgi:hypothetical protein